MTRALATPKIAKETTNVARIETSSSRTNAANGLCNTVNDDNATTIKQTHTKLINKRIIINS